MPPRTRTRKTAQAKAEPTGPAEIVSYDPAFPLADLHPYHKNPRRGDVELIRESLRVNGQYRPLVVNQGTLTGRPNEILAGNHTYAALKAEKRETGAVTFIDVDDERAKRIVLVDNRASDKAKNDDDVLASLLGDLGDLEGTGFTDEDLAKMLGSDDEQDTSSQLGDVGYAIIIDCRDEEHQAELLATFEDEGLDARPLMM